MKKSVNKKKPNKLKFLNEFVAFGNKKKVFWGITIATIIISILGIPVMIDDEIFFKRFLVIWILEILYVGMWVKWVNKKKIK